MQYALLIYDDPSQWENIPEDDYKAIYAGYVAVSNLPATQSGRQLQGIETARSVRVENGERVVSDGPFADTKEVLGGFYLIDADTLEAAEDIAAQVPSARMGGTVEVRPVVEM
jgi:hypothetical protein